MNLQITRQASAFFCAGVATLAMLVGTDSLATHMNNRQHVAAVSAPADAVAPQIVVVIGQRAARS